MRISEMKLGGRGRCAVRGLLVSLMLTLCSAGLAYAGVVVKRGASDQGPQGNPGAGQYESSAPSGMQGTGVPSGSNSGASGGGSGQSDSAIWKDIGAPAPTRMYGYTYEDAVRAAEALYSFEKDPVKKEICSSTLVNSIWYDPDRLVVTGKGTPMLCIYDGPISNYEQSYLLTLDGLEFFANPTAMFLRQGTDRLLLCISLDHRFTEAEAYENYQTILGFLADIEAVKQAAAGRDDADRAKLICDYVADRLAYDSSYQLNSLGDALRTGVSACVGYNSMTELLFEHCGLSYVNVVGEEKNGPMQHIFGMAKIASTWLVFDTTNYDRDSGKEPFWIFSDQYREGMFYKNLQLVESVDG